MSREKNDFKVTIFFEKKYYFVLIKTKACLRQAKKKNGAPLLKILSVPPFGAPLLKILRVPPFGCPPIKKALSDSATRFLRCSKSHPNTPKASKTALGVCYVS